MKSVKNFFIERMNSIDHSDDGGGSSGTSSKKKHQLDKLKYSSAGGSSSIDSPLTADSVGGASTPSIVSHSGGDPSPTPSMGGGGATTADTAGGIRSPASGSPNDPPLASPFNFTPTESGGGGGGVPSSLSAPAIKPLNKSRRKISLPWFRQSSVTSRVSLSRQHTIDSPASFRLFRQPSSSTFKVGTQEATWVVSDYIATPGTNELSVTKGQQVEVAEAPSATEPDFCLVRLNPQSDDAAVQEGLVPVSILKPPPGSQAKASATTRSKDNSSETIQEQSNNRGKPDPLTSSTKRRGFSGRKWLPQPLRKLSQSKVEKPPTEKSLIKKTSEKNLRLPHKHAEHDEENIPTTNNATSSNYSSSGAPATSAATVAQQNASAVASQQDYEAEEEAGLELPPPMKPIQEPHLMANGPPAFNKDLKENATNMASTGKMDSNTTIDLSEIEQIVKEKTEQHEEKSKFLKPSFDISSSSCAAGSSSEMGNGRVGGGGGSGGNAELDLCYATDNNDENNTEISDIEAAQKKRMMALGELLSTEELYIQDLAEIVNGYIAEIRNSQSEIPLPDDLKGGKERMVFGNIEAIYEWHRDYFLKALRRCQKTPAELGPMIKRYERKFHMYIVYCQNKPVSEHIVTEHFLYFDQIRQKLRHRLDLSDLLIKPVQRITKYELLLREITKQTERAGLVEEVSSMEESFHVMKVVCKAVNDMMVLRRLQKFEGKIMAQGKLLLHGPLTCIEDAKNAERNACMVQKPRELQVFLFEQSIIFADIVGKKTQFTSPAFIYRSQIQVNKMQLEELPNNRFLLKSIDPNRPDLHMICYAATVDQNREWLETIRNILQSQHDFLKAITSPIQYQKELTKET